MASIEEKKAEALWRMKELGLYGPTFEQFDKLGRISLSQSPIGLLFWIDGEDLKRVRDFEQKFNALVYFVVRTHTADGTLDSFLFVSDHPEEWEDDRRLLKDGEVIAYVYNRDFPLFSDIGSIGIELTEMAGLRRIW